jgi:hypothetical protein
MSWVEKNPFHKDDLMNKKDDETAFSNDKSGQLNRVNYENINFC